MDNYPFEDIFSSGRQISVDAYPFADIFQDTPSKPYKEPSIIGEIPKGLVAGIQQLRGFGYGLTALAGEVLGSEAVTDWAKEGLVDVERETPTPAVGSFTDIGKEGNYVSDAAKYLAYGVSTNLPNMVLSMGGGVVGGMIGKKLVGEAARAAIGKAAEKAILAKGIERGAVVGAGTASVGMEAGSIASDQLTETGKVDPLRAMTGAIPAGILDVIPEWYLAKRLGWLGKDVAEMTGGRAVRALKVAGQQFTMEAPTEAMQSVIERASVPGKSISNADAWNEYIDSFVLGGMTGGVMGGAGGVFTKKAGQPTPQPETQAGAPGPPPTGPLPAGTPPGAPAPPEMTRGEKLSPEFFRDIKKALSTGVDNDGNPFTQNDARGIFEAYRGQKDADPISVAVFEKILGPVEGTPLGEPVAMVQGPTPGQTPAAIPQVTPQESLSGFKVFLESGPDMEAISTMKGDVLANHPQLADDLNKAIIEYTANKPVTVPETPQGIIPIPAAIIPPAGEQTPGTAVPPSPPEIVQPGAPGETIRAASIRLNGKIYEGKSHPGIVDEFDLDTRNIPGNDIGFITNTGRYVTREEASRIVGIPETQFDVVAEELKLKAPYNIQPAAPPGGKEIISYRGQTGIPFDKDIETTHMGGLVFSAETPEIAGKYAQGQRPSVTELRAAPKNMLDLGDKILDGSQDVNIEIRKALNEPDGPGSEIRSLLEKHGYDAVTFKERAGWDATHGRTYAYAPSVLKDYPDLKAPEVGTKAPVPVAAPAPASGYYPALEKKKAREAERRNKELTLDLKGRWVSRAIDRIDREGNAIIGPSMGGELYSSRTRYEYAGEGRPSASDMRQLREAGFKKTGKGEFTGQVKLAEGVQPKTKKTVPVKVQTPEQIAKKRALMEVPANQTVDFIIKNGYLDINSTLFSRGDALALNRRWFNRKPFGKIGAIARKDGQLGLDTVAAEYPQYFGTPQKHAHEQLLDTLLGRGIISKLEGLTDKEEEKAYYEYLANKYGASDEEIADGLSRENEEYVKGISLDEIASEEGLSPAELDAAAKDAGDFFDEIAVKRQEPAAKPTKESYIGKVETGEIAGLPKPAQEPFNLNAPEGEVGKEGLVNRQVTAGLFAKPEAKAEPVAKEPAPNAEDAGDLKKAQKFRQLAEGLQKQIDQKRNPAIGQQNVTARRARIAEGMGKEADAIEEVQNIMKGMADAIESGTLPDSLKGISNRTQVEAIRNAAKYNWKFSSFTGEDKNRFVNAGIKTESALTEAKSAIREYIKGPSAETLKEQEIKKAERELIGVKIPGFFPTPKTVGTRLVEMADIEPGMDVLEPSAGKGDLAEVIREQEPKANLKVIEWLDSLRNLLAKKDFTVAGDDFLKHTEKYDRIIQNPPFEKGQDIDHVQHAYELLKSGGRLVSIMSAGPFSNGNAKSQDFRTWFESVNGEQEDLKDAFKGAESFRQTGVNAKIITIDKTRETGKGVEMYSAEGWGSVDLGHEPYVPTLEEVKNIFKGQEVTEIGGKIWVKTRAGHLTIESVDSISISKASFSIGYGRGLTKADFIAGKYSKGKIQISTQAGTRTLSHESIHFLEDAGILNASDVAILRGHIKGLVREGKIETANKDDIGGSEDRTNFIADALTAEKPKKGFVGRVIARIREFLDRLMNAFGKRTAGGVVRDVKSGKVFEGGLTPSKETGTNYAVTPKPGTANIPPETTPKAVGGNEIIKAPVDYKAINGEWTYGTINGKEGYVVRNLPDKEGKGRGNSAWAQFDTNGNLTQVGRKEFLEIPTDETLSKAKEDVKKFIEFWKGSPKPNENIFLRLGEYSRSGRSINYVTGEKEKGISAYRLRQDIYGSHYVDENEYSFPFLGMAALRGKPAYIIKGEVIGKGGDGEPLLRNVKKITQLTQDQIDKIYGNRGEIGFDLPNPSRPSEVRGREQYAVEKILSNKEGYKKAVPSTETPQKDWTPDKVKAWIQNEADLVLQEAVYKLTPDVHKMGNLKKFLTSPEWYEHPVLSRIVRLFVRDRNEIFHELYGHLNNLEQPMMEENTVGELAQKLKHKGLNWKQKMTGKASKEYQDVLKIIDEADIDSVEYNENNLKKAKYSTDTIAVWKAFRESYDKALDVMTAQMKAMMEQIEEEAAFKGIKPADFSDMYTTLKGAIATMGQLRGSYAPRIRQGNWAVTAYKGEGDNIKHYREHRFSHMAANRLAGKLKEEGWKIRNVSEVEKLPEDVYQDLKTVSVAKAIEAAIENMSKGQKGTVAQNQTIKFNEEILQQVADMIRARGFRATMIRRTPGSNVVKGYIEDPIERHAIYINNVSRGIAKAKVAGKAMEELSGKTIKGRRFGGIDPKSEAEVYSTAKDYIEEQLRNLDKTDRIIGWAKSIATLKFLGFSVRSAVVNMTSIVTTSPGAIHQYVTEGRASFMKINRAMVTAGNDSRKFMMGHEVGSADDIRFLQEEKRLGWDDPQYTRDMISRIGSIQNRAWAATMDGAMWMFGKTEQWNRLTTMLASYRLARGEGKSHAEASELAKTASDKSQGIYGRATLPAFAWGRNPAAKLAQTLYVYTKFSHNYLHLLHDLGFRQHNWKAFAYTLLAPMIISGVSAWPLKDVTIMPLLGILFSILRIKDKDEDFEKWMWDLTRKYLGEGAEIAGRYGAMGALGMDISGSLSIGVGIPRNFWEWGGAVGGAAKEGYTAYGEAKKGNYLQMAEHLLPAGFANIPKAYREATEGPTTQRGNRVWDERGRPYKPTAGETAMRAVGFRSSRQAATTERLYEAKQEATEFNDRRSAIYEHYRAYLSKPEGKRDPDEHKKIREKVREFNRSIRSAHMTGEVSEITYEAMRRQVDKMKQASKKERAMMR